MSRIPETRVSSDRMARWFSGRKLLLTVAERAVRVVGVALG